MKLGAIYWLVSSSDSLVLPVFQGSVADQWRYRHGEGESGQTARHAQVSRAMALVYHRHRWWDCIIVLLWPSHCSWFPEDRLLLLPVDQSGRLMVDQSGRHMVDQSGRHMVDQSGRRMACSLFQLEAIVPLAHKREAIASIMLFTSIQIH